MKRSLEIGDTVTKEGILKEEVGPDLKEEGGIRHEESLEGYDQEKETGKDKGVKKMNENAVVEIVNIQDLQCEKCGALISTYIFCHKVKI